jgi:hypothetical protein
MSQMRTLHLTNPLMHGADVEHAQQLLAKNPYGSFAPGSIDGEYGPATANATKQAKFALGYPDDSCDTAFGPKLAGFLGGDPLPADFKARHQQRAKQIANGGAIRDKILENAHWGIQNEPQIHYEQLRPMDGLEHPHKLPLQTDCSGFVTLCYKWAGGPDPNGLKFSGAGYTGTMLQACSHIARSAARPGDLVVWGPPPGHHVAMVLEPGSDPWLVSHGQEKGPIRIQFSVEDGYQKLPATWLTCLH